MRSKLSWENLRHLFLKKLIEKKLQEIKILKIKKLYFNGDMHFNDQGFRILAKKVADWVIQNPEESIGFTPIQ